MVLDALVQVLLARQVRQLPLQSARPLLNLCQGGRQAGSLLAELCTQPLKRPARLHSGCLGEAAGRRLSNIGMSDVNVRCQCQILG